MWENTNLGSICKMQAGKFVSASEINENLQKDLFPCYGGNGLRGYTKIYNNDGKYSLIGRQGALCGNVTLANGKFHATEHAVVVSPNNGIDTDWCYYLLNYLNLNQYATGMAQPGLSVQNLEKVEAVIPNTTGEQNKIAAFLSLIDERISTQNKIVRELETLIKVLSDKLFLRQFRFVGFEDEWKKCKVADLLDFFSTNSLSWEQLEYETDNLYNLHYGLIHQGLSTQIDMTVCFLPRIKNKFIPKNYTLCQNGDIAFADASEDTKDVAKVVEFVNCNEKEIICGLHTIHGRDKLNLTINGFKGYAFSSLSFRHQIRQLAQGTKVFSISPKILSECYIDIPSKGEQLKISDLLSLVDKKIEVERKLLHLYKVQKRHFLQQMFI